MDELIALPPRLLAVSELAGPCGVLADVGTDHAYLPVFMMQRGLCDRALACDVNEGPLLRAKSAVEKYGLDYRISLIRSDGLHAVPREYDSLVIAGMGGDLIARILQECPPDCAKKITLQPMTKPEVLRRFLFRNGYSILRERAITEGEKHYIVFSVARVPAPCFSDFDCFLPQNLDLTPDALEYLEHSLSSHQKRLLGLRRAEIPDSEAIAFEESLSQRLNAMWQAYSRRLRYETF
ncbi:MAG: SAM-dependent methyltransferase [Clostridia bacterium]|nr:SAM-dependent methyltransferase [Clostridia bacterium]